MFTSGFDPATPQRATIAGAPAGHDIRVLAELASRLHGQREKIHHHARKSSVSQQVLELHGLGSEAADAHGRAVQRRIGRRHGRSVAREMLKELTPAELAQLEALCRKLTQ